MEKRQQKFFSTYKCNSESENFSKEIKREVYLDVDLVVIF